MTHEVDALKEALAGWNSVAECEHLVHEFQLTHGNFGRGLRGGKLWRECFHAVRFARALNAEHLRTGNDPPDFEFLISGVHLQIELVVARDVDDATSQQFLQAANFIDPIKPDVEEIGPSTLEISWKSLPNRIADQVKAKSGKGYPPSFILAVAASSWWWEDEGDAMENAIRDACQPYFQCFADILVLAGSHLIRLKK